MIATDNLVGRAWRPITAFVFLSCCTNAVAQENLNIVQDAIEDSLRSSLWERLNTGPDGNLIGDQNEFAISVFNERGTFNITHSVGTRVRAAIGSENSHRLTNYKFSFSAPIDTDRKSVPLPTLDGLKSAYTIGFNINRTTVPVNTSMFEELNRTFESWDEVSNRIALKFIESSTNANECRREFDNIVLSSFAQHVVMVHLDERNSDWTIVPGLEQMTLWEAIQSTLTVPTEGLSSEQLSALGDLIHLVDNLEEHISPDTTLMSACAAELMEDLVDEVQESWKDVRWSSSLGLEAKLGNDKHEYYIQKTLARESEYFDVHSVTFFSSWFKAASQGDRNLTLSYSYQKGYRSQEEATKCLEMIVKPEEDCRTAVFDAPAEVKQSLLSLEWRTRMDRAFGSRPMAYQVKAVYDFENDAFGVDVPIYLLSIGGDDLNFGIRFGWESEKQNSEVGFFYGQKY